MIFFEGFAPLLYFNRVVLFYHSVAKDTAGAGAASLVALRPALFIDT